MSIKQFQIVKNIRTLFGVAVLTLAIGSSSLVTAATQGLLGDRVIVAINDKNFTQRQLEMYFVMRQSLMENQTFGRELISQANWVEALAFFIEEMVLLQEADRVGGTIVAPDQWQKLSKRSVVQISKSKSLEQLVKRLEMDQPIKDSILTSILRVEGLKNFKNQTSLSRNDEDQNKNGRGSEWMNEIFSRTLIRHYKNAKVYQPIGKGLQ